MKNNMTLCKTICLAIVGSGSFSALYGDSLPSFDPADPKSARAEYKRITELYKDDLDKMAGELQKFARTVAKAAGVEAEIEREQSLLKKYGPASGISITTRGHGMAGDITDNVAWVSSVESKGNEIIVKFFLDNVRYKEPALAHNIRVELRRKGRSGDDEMILSSGRDTAYSFRVRLPYEQRPGWVYVVSLTIPETERSDFVVQVNADIEPRWSTLARIELEANAKGPMDGVGLHAKPMAHQ